MKNFSESGINKYRIRRGSYGSTDETGNYGAFNIPLSESTTALVIAADGDDTGWEHVSVHVVYRNKKGKRKERIPTWEEMCKIKDFFWDQEETVLQFHPPYSEYVNNHVFTLHLWRPENVEIPLPPSLLVGYKPIVATYEGAL